MHPLLPCDHWGHIYRIKDHYRVSVISTVKNNMGTENRTPQKKNSPQHFKIGLPISSQLAWAIFASAILISPKRVGRNLESVQGYGTPLEGPGGIRVWRMNTGCLVSVQILFVFGVVFSVWVFSRVDSAIHFSPHCF